jgi:hypothetical protein
MVATLSLPAIDSLSFDGMLSDALVFNWNEVMPESAAGQIQIEYHVGPAGGVEFVKVWGAILRGHWDLICSYWMRSGTSNRSGLRFANEHKSGVLGGMLESIMQHQGLFRVETANGKDCTIQVSPPTDKERISALKMADTFRDRLDS